ncbi:MAG: glycosyltransferase family 4 protein [Elusimicrobiota bacterium]|nr:glycosyltransferase family 4 protein [Endomicrobiia bacterium]MDW8166030.1 glycosyltransferase family 4 protein [Elusimicrobiota bacterium]
MKRINILVLASINPKSFIRDGQRWAYFRYWPEGRYHIDVIGAYQIPFFSKYIEARFFKFFFIQAVVALSKIRKYDFIIATDTRSILGIAFFKWIFRFRRPKLIDFDIECFGRIKRGFKLKLIKKAANAIDLVIYHVSTQKSYYERYLPELNNKTQFVPLGASPYEKTLSWEDSNNDNYVVALSGAMKLNRKIRDWETLIDAWDNLGDINLKLKIIGQKKFTEKDIGKRKIPNSIELYPYIPRIKLTPIVEKAKFAILPLWEVEHAQGQLSLLYLMSLGKAVIVGNTTGIRDYVIDGETVLLYQPGNKDQLLQKIEFLLTHPQEIERIAKNAYKVVREKYNDKIFSEKIYEIISGLNYE